MNDRSWLPVVPLEELKERGIYAAKIGDLNLGLFMVEGEIFSIDNLCTHGNACLTEGVVEGYLVECPLHAGLVDLRSGKAAGAPITRDSRTYPVKVELGQVLVQIDAAPLSGMQPR